MSAQIQVELGNPEAARECLENAIRRSPTDEELWVLLAEVWEDIGDRDAAINCYNNARRNKNEWGYAIGAQLQLEQERASPSLVEQAKQLINSIGLELPDRAMLGFGLGKVYQNKDPQLAWRYFRLANQLRRQQIGSLDAGALSEKVDGIIAAFGEVPEIGAADSSGPIFIVGMPRSGTSLIEQILGRHSAVLARGEMPYLPMLCERLPDLIGSIRDWPEAVADILPEHCASLAEFYLSRARPDSAGKTAIVTDKLPFNYYRLGLAATIFPAAQFIACERDPVDIATSIFTENFGLTQKYATSLRDIRIVMSEKDRIMSHWESVMSSRIFRLSYEELIKDQEGQTRAIAQWLGLPWEQEMLNFHMAERPVLTPSKWQVRQPIYNTSIGRWRRFRPEIDADLQDAGLDGPAG